MNVNLNSISLQQRKFSGTNSIGGIHLPDFNDKYVILSILVDTFISKISFPMQPGPEIGSISDA